MHAYLWRGVGAFTVDDAEILAAALEIVRRMQGGVMPPRLTVAELYALYSAAMGKRKSWPVINDRLEPVVKYLATREVMGLRVIDWSDYRAQREQQEIKTGKPGRRYGAHTINMELMWFRAMLNWAVAAGRIPSNPLHGAKAVKTRSKRSTAPAEHDVSALLKDADDRMRFIILCAADGAMRRNEAVQMRHDWVDREAMCIRLPGWACKSGKPRTVAMTSRMLDAIDALPRPLRSPYVLVNPTTGHPYNKDHVSRWFRHISDAAGIEAAPADKRVVLHDLRRGAATSMVRRGVGIEAVSSLLGHASLDQTRDYVEIGESDVSAAREAIERGIERDKKRGK